MAASTAQSNQMSFMQSADAQTPKKNSLCDLAQKWIS
jgi:hypothetical protein